MSNSLGLNLQIDLKQFSLEKSPAGGKCTLIFPLRYIGKMCFIYFLEVVIFKETNYVELF